jgi:hypothetical protein
VAALTTTFNPSLVNVARLTYNYWGNRGSTPDRARCPGVCFALDSPSVTISGASFSFGKSPGNPSSNVQPRLGAADSVIWQRGNHRVRFGGAWEEFFPKGSNPRIEPALITLYSPAAARAAGIAIPASFLTVDDIMRLPLLSFRTAVGDSRVPVAYRYEQSRLWSTWRFYAQDTWRVRPNFTLNYGLGWSYDTFPLNHDLSKPDYLLPILGARGIAPSRKDPNNFAPAAGFAWSVTRDNKTVIRGGVGIYYDQYLWSASEERTTLAPRGDGRNVLDGSYVPNPIPGVAGVPAETPLDFSTAPTQFRGSDLLSILPAVRAGLQQLLGDPGNTDLSIRNIQVFKQQSILGGLITQDFTTAYAEHFNFGIQREVARELVVSADVAFRQFIHTDMAGVDYNHFNSVRGPVIRTCVGDERLDPKAACSTGQILVNTSGGRSHYKALLVKADKRFNRRTQMLAAYALSSQVGFIGTGSGFNKDNWFTNFGPLATDRRHVMNVSGIVDLPKGFQVSFISSYTSAAPFTASLANLDLDGDGTTGDVLPGTRANQFGRGLGKSDLIRLVDQFNQSFAGGKTPRGQAIPRLTLPADFNLGDSYITQDLRASRVFVVRDRARLTAFGELFNLLNFANLSGQSGNLQQTSSFGQPTTRASQVFGSGGPRAFQFGARLSF